MIAFQLLLICDGLMHFFGGGWRMFSKVSKQRRHALSRNLGNSRSSNRFPFLSRGSLLPWEIPQPLPLSSLFPCSSLAQVINVSHHRPKAPPPLKQWTAKEKKPSRISNLLRCSLYRCCCLRLRKLSCRRNFSPGKGIDFDVRRRKGLL